MILHVDMDAFYASVEEREEPSLKGKPLIVGGLASSRGVVSAANYAARKFGVYSAMPTATALRKCPHLNIIKPRHDLYASVSRDIRQIFFRYTPVIEPLSLDEAFLDCSGSEMLYGDAEAIGKRIKDDIGRELGLVASVGVAPNKFLAKLASDHEKPDGFTVVNGDRIQEFLDPMPVDRIWGIGKVANARLQAQGIFTIAEMRNKTPEFMTREFGQQGELLWDLAHGRDERKVNPDSEVKSISQETTYSTDITDYRVIEATALHLVEGVGFRLREAGLKGKTLILKIRFGDFRTITRSRTIPGVSSQTSILWDVIQDLVREALQNSRFSVRLIGVGVSNFDVNSTKAAEPVQQSLFPADLKGDPGETRSGALDQLSDDIKARFGKEIIKRGKSIRHR